MRSVLTEYEEYSVFSGREAECTHHLIFGKGLRELSEKYGLKIPLTNSEHNMGQKAVDQIHENPAAEKLSKMLGQIAFEKEFYKLKAGVKSGTDPAREEFIKIFGKSYL